MGEDPRVATGAAGVTPGGPREAADGMPEFLVIGAQKSASTYLQDQLSLHPDIEIPEGEVRSFEDPFYLQDAVSDLPSLFRRPSSGVVRGIKRPSYLGRPEVAERLHRHLPQAKLFVVIREPIARAVSSYYHLARHGFVPLRPIDEAFEALLEDQWSSRYPRSRDVLTFGLYGQHLERYLQYYKDRSMMVLEQTALTRHPEAHLPRAFAFVGVDPERAGTQRQVAHVSNRGVYAPLRLRLLRTKNRTGFRYTPELDRRDPRRRTPWGWAYNAGVVQLDRKVLSRFDPGRPPELSARTRSRLEEYYRDDAERLGDLLPRWQVEAPWL